MFGLLRLPPCTPAIHAVSHSGRSLSFFLPLSVPTVRAVMHLKMCRCCCSVFQERGYGERKRSVLLLLSCSCHVECSFSLSPSPLPHPVFLRVSLLNLQRAASRHLNPRDLSYCDWTVFRAAGQPLKPPTCSLTVPPFCLPCFD